VHGLINLDFADVKAVMSNAGSALMGIGRASGDNRAVEAAQQAVDSPLLEVSIDGARGVLFNVIGGDDMSMHEINTVAETITASADKDANIIFGATIDPELEGELIVTVVATGFEDSYFSKQTSAHLKTMIAAEAEENNKKTEEVSKTAALEEHEDIPGDINMDLNKTVDEHVDFTAEDDNRNIWKSEDLEKNDNGSENNNEDQFVSQSYDEEEIEKPSFLRRFKKRKKAETNNSEDSDNV
jgi:cell division protein FtsZ